MATVIRASGSTPQRPGARLLLQENGETAGTVGGGAIEHLILEELRNCLSSGKRRVVTRDLGRDLGMCCGGRMEIFVERIEEKPRLILFGAGHVALPTARIAKIVGFEITVIDDRDELNSEDRFPECNRILKTPTEAIANIKPRSGDYFLIMTHDHRLDEEALDLYARQPHRYVGMIGSRRKLFRVLQRIHARKGLPDLGRVYSPVGLELGAVSPEEIAVSIMAELVAIRHGEADAKSSQPSLGKHMRAVNDPRLARVLEGNVSPEDAAREEQSKRPRS